MKRLVVRTIILAGIVSMLLLFIDPYFLRNEYGDVASFNSFYDADKNSVEILLLGNSHLHRGIDPYIIEAKCSADTEMLIGGGLTIAQVYYNLLEALEYQNPKLVVIESWPLIVPNTTNNEVLNDDGFLMVNRFGTEYFKRFGAVKIDEIVMLHPDKKLYHTFNSIRLHDRWTDLNKWSVSLSHKLNLVPKDVLQGTIKRNEVITPAQINAFSSRKIPYKDMLISEQETAYLQKIIKLSKEKQFEILFITVPVYQAYYNKTKSGFQKVANQLEAIAKDQRNIKVLDINGMLEGLDYTYIMKEKQIKVNQHLNYKGIIKTSNILANYIAKTYHLKKNSELRRKTPESILYNSKWNNIDTTFFGKITSFNNIPVKDLVDKKTLIVIRDQDEIKIDGWMLKDGIEMNKAQKIVALKKDKDFIFFTGKELKERPTHQLLKSKGDAYRDLAYTFSISKQLLEKGKYKIYHIIKSESGNVFVQDTRKWIVIE